MIQKSMGGKRYAETIMHFLRCKILLTGYILLFVAIFTGCAASNKNLKEDAEIHYRLGLVHLNGGNIPEALKELTAAVKIYNNDASFHNVLGLAYFAKDMDDDAIKHLKEAVKINEKFSDAHTHLSAVYLKKKEWDLAIAEARIAVADIFYTTPEFAYFNMGRAFYEKADYIKAEESYKKAIPKYPVAYYTLGLTYMKMNKDKEAAEMFGLVIKNVPNYIDAHYNLGLVFIKLKDKKAALNAFQEVIRLAPDGDKAPLAREYMELLK